MSIQKILVPVDFSDCSKNAVHSAIKLAAAFQAELTILHAFQIPTVSGEAGGAMVVQELSQEAEYEAKGAMNELIADFPSLKHIKFKKQIIHSFPHEAIENSIEHNHYDLVIMGTKGSSGLEEKLIGSNTYSVIKSSAIPVLALPEDKNIHELEDIAFAGDYQKIEDREIFDVLLELCNFYNSTIHILHVTESREKITADEAFEARKFKQYFKNVQHNYHLIQNDDIEAGIYEYIDTHPIHLLAMVPRKHNVFDRIFKESLTKKIACHARVPFLALT